MRLNIYAQIEGANGRKRVSQTDIEKTYEIDNYDLMYGTVEDILDILDGVSETMSDDSLIDLINKNRYKINDLMFDIFPDLTEDEIRRTKVTELVPVFIDLFSFVREGFGNSAAKN